MLRTRVLTALVMLPVVLGMLFLAGEAPWAAFALAITLIASWEWSRLCGFSRWGARAYLVACGAIGGALFMAYQRMPPEAFASISQAVLVASAYFWIFGVPVWLAMKLRPPRWALGAAGWFVVWPMWAAMIELRAVSPWLLLALAVLVWVADISAYFAGRRFGRVKLAPAISPGKTWEGVWSGMLGALALAGFWLWLDLAVTVDSPSVFTRLYGRAGGVMMVLMLVFLAAMSVVGDLFESLVKRGAGAKDSSALLPGHGGVLDRVDALLPVFPIALALASL